MSWLKNTQMFFAKNPQIYLSIGLGLALLGWVSWQFNLFNWLNDSSGHEIYLEYIEGNDKDVPMLSKKSDSHGQMGRFIEMAKHLNGEMELSTAQIELTKSELNRQNLMKYWLNCIAVLNGKDEINPGFTERAVNSWAKFRELCQFFALKVPPQAGNLYNNAVIIGQKNNNTGSINTNAETILANRYLCKYDEASSKRESMLGPRS
jgi:hypothetical protein